MLENTLVKEGRMEITLPNSEQVVTGCDAWALSGASSLTAPTAATSYIAGTLTGSAPNWKCSWASDLTGGASYGVRLASASSTAKAG